MLEIKHLTITFRDARGGEAVRGIDLHVEAGERLGLVGESGSGKTVTALAVAGLVPRSRVAISGEILFEGRDLLRCSRRELRQIQGREIGMVFQEPMTSLDPLMRIGPQIEETLRIHTDLSRDQRRALALEVMEQVDLPEPAVTYDKYPHQLSGGQRQRAMIAAAIIAGPRLLIADEPTTALDVTVQAQILALLRRISQERNMGILFISHDLNVVRRLCTRVAVMYDGRIVEQGPAEAVFRDPQHDYTRRLVAAIPGRRRRDA